VTAFRQQAVIESPAAEVWDLVGNPIRYPEWASEVIEVTGLAEVAEHATFEQTTKTPLGGKDTTIFEIEKLDDLREIKLRCQTSGYYSRWRLTPAQENTFAEVEIGVEPTSPMYGLFFGTLGRRYLRRISEQSVAGIQRALRSPAQRSR
jgi:hypothetical protein